MGYESNQQRHILVQQEVRIRFRLSPFGGRVCLFQAETSCELSPLMV